ncbi:MAG TPA: ankyrin repeat domain-containing protein [Leptospiraceae bacterium]|nr:ankyrin repeat domain-containing protein [Leptospiraceae bacterium]
MKFIFLILFVYSEIMPNSLTDAAAAGDLDKVKTLIKKEKDLNEKDEYGKTALMYAEEKRYSEIVKILIEAKADLNVRDNSGQTVLFRSLISDLGGGVDSETVKMLIKSGANVNAKDDTGKTPLMHCTAERNLEMVSTLIRSKAKINERDGEGKTALIYAVNYDADEILKFLIRSRADVNIRDENGKTALIYSVEEGKTDITDILLEADADPEIKDKTGNTALSAASRKKDIEFKKNEYSDETKAWSKTVEMLIDSVRKKSIPKIPVKVLRSAEKEKKVRRSPKNIFEYLLILPPEFTQLEKDELNYDYGLRLKYYQEIIFNRECESKKPPDCIEQGFENLDLQNGYLRYREAGLEEYIEMSLFKKSNKTYIIGVTKYFGGDSGRFNTYFLTYKNRKWTDITEKILPELSYKLFLNPKDHKLIGKEQKNDPRGFISLPRSGTDVFYNADTANSCEGDMGDDTVSKRKNCKEILKKAVRNSVKLKWNPDKGIFALK